MSWIVAIAICVGACLGSFAHAAAWRAVRGQDWITRPSQCFACTHRLRWHENLPLIGWLKTRGRCARCKQKIPARYFFTELAMALLAIVLVLRLGSVQALIFAPFITLCAIIFLTDLDAFRIPDWASLGGAAIGIALACLNAPNLPDWQSALIGSASGFGLLYGTNALYKAVRGRDGLGLGDAKLMAMFGAWLGPAALLPILFLASFIGALVGLGLIATRHKESSRDAPMHLPFGCFLVPMAIGFLCFAPIFGFA